MLRDQLLLVLRTGPPRAPTARFVCTSGTELASAEAMTLEGIVGLFGRPLVKSRFPAGLNCARRLCCSIGGTFRLQRLALMPLFITYYYD
jgi:hypothetical protein